MQRDGLAVENDDDFPELLQSYAIIVTELLNDAPWLVNGGHGAS
jgi:hypothetical protein